MTRKELELKICLLNLLIAIDNDIVDWRDYPNLWPAVCRADERLDLWAGTDLREVLNGLFEQLNNLQNDQ
jgi:hypothetical protein